LRERERERERDKKQSEPILLEKSFY